MKKISLLLFLLILLPGFNGFGQSFPVRRGDTPNLRAAERVETVDQKVVRIAKAHSLPPRLFYALIHTESAFKQSARSHKGAGCLTQLMPATARRFGLTVNAQTDERFSNPEKCLNAGAEYLAFLLKTFDGDVRLALAGYNAGEGAVIKYGRRIPPFRETVQYVEKISLAYYGQRGHGIEAAYNQTKAEIWVNELYNRRKKATFRQTPVTSASSAAISPAFPVGNEAGEKTTADGKKSELKTVTRVRVEPNVRLRTTSLTF